jgi:hypothetical protein
VSDSVNASGTVVVTSELEFWRQDPSAKAESVAREVEMLAHRARAAGLSVTAYMLDLAAVEARKESGSEAKNIQQDS